MKGYRLRDRLGYRVSRLAGIMQNWLDKSLAEHNITRTMWCVLSAIVDHGSNTPSAIADYIGITRPAISRTLREMEARGLLVRNGSATDGREAIIKLTKKGLATAQAARDAVEALNTRFTSKINEQQLSELLNTIETLCESEEKELTSL